MGATSFKTLDDLDATGKKVLLRADLNVPVRNAQITDATRILRLLPTIQELAQKGAKVIVVSHFDRPKGRPVPEMSLGPIADALGTRWVARSPLSMTVSARRPGRRWTPCRMAMSWCWKTPASTPGGAERPRAGEGVRVAGRLLRQ